MASCSGPDSRPPRGVELLQTFPRLFFLATFHQIPHAAAFMIALIVCQLSPMTLATWLTLPQACNHITACAISLVTRW